MKDVAIIVPIYNVEKYVEKCLHSLINQTYKKIKIYAIIDGSPDNSIKIVQEMQKKDNRIICINKENGGYGSVLEYAINNIKEEYFIICDPDDWLGKDAVEILYEAINNNHLDIVIGDKYLVYSDNESIEYSSSDPLKVSIPNKIYEKKDLGIFSLLAVSPHSKMYRVKNLKGIKFPYKVSYTDWYLYLYAVSKCNRIMYIDTPLSYYLIDRDGNSISDKSKKAFDAHLTVMEFSLNEIKIDNNYLKYTFCDGYKGLLIICAKLNKNDINKVNIEKLDNIRKKLKKCKNNIFNIKEINLYKKLFLCIILSFKPSTIIKLLRTYIKITRKSGVK